MLGEENSNKIIFFACISRPHSFSFFSNVLGGLFFSSLDLWVFSQFLDVVVVVVVIVCVLYAPVMLLMLFTTLWAPPIHSIFKDVRDLSTFRLTRLMVCVLYGFYLHIEWVGLFRAYNFNSNEMAMHRKLNWGFFRRKMKYEEMKPFTLTWRHLEMTHTQTHKIHCGSTRGKCSFSFSFRVSTYDKLASRS